MANEDLSNKLAEETKKFDDLCSGRQDIEEKLARKANKMKEDKSAVAEQDAKLTELRERIEEEQKQFDEQSQQLDQAKKLNKFEENKERDLQQKHAALTSKLDFIEKFYDYKGNVQGMNLEVFRGLM